MQKETKRATVLILLKCKENTMSFQVLNTWLTYKNQKYNGACSNNFLKDGWKIITLERLFQNFYGRSLHNAIWTIHDRTERLKFIVDNVEKITGLSDFGKYMNKLLTIDDNWNY